MWTSSGLVGRAGARGWRWSAIVAGIVLCATGTQAMTASASDRGEDEPRNLAAGLGYTWSEQPDASYPDSGRQLTDGEHGELDHADPAWVGHVRGQTREVVFDLGARKSISEVNAHFLQDWPENSILVPLTVSFEVSDDNEHWAPLADTATRLLWGEGPPRDETYRWDGAEQGVPGRNPEHTMAYARYVKVSFTVHTNAHQFIDEIEVHGHDGRRPGAVPGKVRRPAYLSSHSVGIRNLALLYNGHYENGKGDWTKDRIVPYLSYVDPAGKPVDGLFDGVLYLGLQTPDGVDFGSGLTRKEDWNWYLDKTFAPDGDLAALDRAAREVAERLDRSRARTKVVLMIPDPGETLTDFGDVDGDGRTENVNESSVGRERALANREKIVRWWIDRLERRWSDADYEHLRLSGLYWLSEQISTSESGPDTMRRVGAAVHENGHDLFWIPHFLGYRAFLWSDVGIDAAALQPNYFFEPMDEARIEDAARLARRYGMGVEIEFDERMLTDETFRERYLAYLDGGVEHGYLDPGVFRAYYQGNDAVLRAATSDDPRQRELYDLLWRFVRGTYSPTER